MNLRQVLAYLVPQAEYALVGDDYSGLTWFDSRPCPTEAECVAAADAAEAAAAWQDIRAERDRLLAASDWTQVADAPVDAAAWAVYRQKLRDIPQDYATPDAVIWPEVP